MQIVEATESHIPGVIELWKEFSDYHRNMDPIYARSEDGPSKFGDYVKGLLGSDDSQVLVATDRGEAVAYSIAQILKRPPVFRDIEYGFISDLGVKSEYRRKGLGEQILNKIFEWFESRRIDRIELLVLAKNEIGVSFWKKHGFEVFLYHMSLGSAEQDSKRLGVE
ncbi:MAG: GNAT family N-acetyltransferase [candidate division Zixibacteria bacterium]|nr:GNAT family N-acetyltransferase [candidate division Zixibacteria bacterium]